MLLLSPLKYMILTSAATTLIFGFIFLFLSQREDAIFMRIWGSCWIVYFITFVIDITHLGSAEISYLLILLKQLVSLTAAVLFLAGTCHFFHISMSPLFIALSVISFFSILMGFSFYTMYTVFLVPNVLINTLLVAWAGCIFYLYTWTQNIPEKNLLCFLILIWSICGNNFTFLLPALQLSILNYLGSLLVLNITIIFLLIIYYKKIYYLLNQQQLRFRLLVENATEHIFLYDYKKGCFEYMSPSAERIFGFSASEVKKDTMKFFRYIRESDQGKLQDLLSTPPSESSMETFQVLRDREDPVWCEIHYSPIAEDNGSVTSLEWILRDITHRKKIEEELKEAENTKRELLEDISHEIKTPVTLILGYIESILNKSVPEASINAYLRNIYSKTELLSTLLNDFMQASAFTSQTMEFRFYETNAKEFIENTFIECEHQLVASQMHSICSSKIPDHVFLVIDTSRIEQVFSNLITNAIRYAGIGATVTLSASVLQVTTQIDESVDADEMVPVGEILIQVTDSGSGISEEDLPYIFQRKYRGNHSIKGSGLGLYICKQIITQHSGRIWAENDSEHKTSFYFTLPFYQDEIFPLPAENSSLAEND